MPEVGSCTTLSGPSSTPTRFCVGQDRAHETEMTSEGWSSTTAPRSCARGMRPFEGDPGHAGRRARPAPAARNPAGARPPPRGRLRARDRRAEQRRIGSSRRRALRAASRCTPARARHRAPRRGAAAPPARKPAPPPPSRAQRTGLSTAAGREHGERRCDAQAAGKRHGRQVMRAVTIRYARRDRGPARGGTCPRGSPRSAPSGSAR